MEKPIERRIAREAKKMTRYEIIIKATAGKLTWTQAADVLGISPRHMRRLRVEYQEYGIDALEDNRSGRPRRKRIREKTVRMICRLKEDVYSDFSIQHFYEKLTEVHGVEVSYSWTKHILQEAGIVKRARGRGKYFRKRECRPMRGMLLHIDGSTHEWIPNLPMWDLVADLLAPLSECVKCLEPVYLDSVSGGRPSHPIYIEPDLKPHKSGVLCRDPQF
jgi:transposase